MKPLPHSSHGSSFAAGLLVWSLALVVVGCTTFHDRPLSAETELAEFEVRSLSDPGLKAFLEANLPAELAAWPLSSWDLDALSLVAFYYHPDLHVARAQLAIAQAARIAVGASLNPSASLAPAFNASTPPPWILGLSFDIPIETAGKRGYRIAQAEHLTDAARLGLASTAWRVRGRVRRNLLGLYAAEESEILLAKQQSIQADAVRVLEAQLQAGAISPFALTQARIALRQAGIAVLGAQQQAVNARVSLAEALGVPLTALDHLAWNFDGFRVAPGDLPDATARRQALLNRTDLRSALAEYAAMQSALQLEVAKQYPDIHLGPGYQLDQTDNKWTLGLAVALPVFDHNEGGIAQAEARRTESAARFLALQARVVSEIDRAVAGFRAALAKAQALEAIHRDIASQLSVAQGMRDAGEISRIELVQRQLDLGNAALAHLGALVTAQEAISDLEDALQSPARLPAALEQSPGGSPAREMSLLRPVLGGFDVMAMDHVGKRLFLNAAESNTTDVSDLAVGKDLFLTVLQVEGPFAKMRVYSSTKM